MHSEHLLLSHWTGAKVVEDSGSKKCFGCVQVVLVFSLSSYCLHPAPGILRPADLRSILTENCCGGVPTALY